MRILYSRIELDPDDVTLDLNVYGLNSTTFLIPSVTTYNKIAIELNNSDIAYTDRPIKLIKK